jgi:hypothetical protein
VEGVIDSFGLVDGVGMVGVGFVAALDVVVGVIGVVDVGDGVGVVFGVVVGEDEAGVGVRVGVGVGVGVIGVVLGPVGTVPTEFPADA